MSAPGVGAVPSHATACGCARCMGKTRLQAEADEGGEQAMSAEDLELAALRAEVARLRAQVEAQGQALVMARADAEAGRELLKAALEAIVPTSEGGLI